jgi:hypothetical protein
MEMTIKDFLNEKCVKVLKKESDSYVELMMDNHKCIQYGNNQYYVSEDYLSGEEEIIYDFLVDNYRL